MAGGDRRRLDEVGALLDAYRPHLERTSFMRNLVYRYLLAAARVAHAPGDQSARDIGRCGLAVLAETRPALSRHPTVRRATSTDAEFAELTAIAGPA